MQNESLAKVLCHNLTVLVHEMYELGIVPEFGDRKEETGEEEPPWTVRFPGA